MINLPKNVLGAFRGRKEMYGKGRMILSPKETEGIVMYTATLGEWRKRNGKF